MLGRIRRLIPAAALLAAHVVIAFVAPSARAELAPAGVSGWTVKHVVMLPGSPERAYDAATGDLSPWWDHKFRENPLRFYIEPWAGGGMYEIWNEEGDGVKHATVIMADRGKTLRFEGPLGLAGNGIVFVTTWNFAAKGDSTELTCNASVAGAIPAGGEKAVDGVWQHFLSGRLKPYMESGKDLEKKRWPRPK